MIGYDEIVNLFFDNIKKIIFPEEWLKLDLTLSKQEILALILLDKHNEIIMSQMASSINIPMSTATGIVDRLVKSGYIERVRDTADRRVVTIRLTEKGKTFVEEFKCSISKYIQLIYDALTEEERQILFQIFIKVTAAINKGNLDTNNTADDRNKIKKIEID